MPLPDPASLFLARGEAKFSFSDMDFSFFSLLPLLFPSSPPHTLAAQG